MLNLKSIQRSFVLSSETSGFLCGYIFPEPVQVWSFPLTVV